MQPTHLTTGHLDHRARTLSCLPVRAAADAARAS